MRTLADRESISVAEAVYDGIYDLHTQLDRSEGEIGAGGPGKFNEDFFVYLAIEMFTRAEERFPGYEHAYVVIGHEEEWNEENVRINRLVATGPYRERPEALASANRHIGASAILGPVVVKTIPDTCANLKCVDCHKRRHALKTRIDITTSGHTDQRCVCGGEMVVS